MSDVGAATARNYRYQYAYGVILMAEALRGGNDYIRIWCELHEDFLCERQDGVFDAYQIKTSDPGLGDWKLTDRELTASISRFVKLIAQFGDRLGKLYFVSNKDFYRVGQWSLSEKRRGRCPEIFLEHLRQCESYAQLKPPYRSAFDDLHATCGCDADEIFSALSRLHLRKGPSRDDFHENLSIGHIAKLDDCYYLYSAQLDSLRDDLVALFNRASSLQVSNPDRHLRSLIGEASISPEIASKCIKIPDDFKTQLNKTLALHPLIKSHRKLTVSVRKLYIMFVKKAFGSFIILLGSLTWSLALSYYLAGTFQINQDMFVIFGITFGFTMLMLCPLIDFSYIFFQCLFIVVMLGRGHLLSFRDERQEIWEFIFNIFKLDKFDLETNAQDGGGDSDSSDGPGDTGS